MKRRSVAVVTGSRAEYGLLAPLMSRLKADPEIDLRLIVTGTHLSERFGMTVQAIEVDGFVVDTCVPLPLDDARRIGTARAMAVALADIAAAIERLEPDIMVVLGDRFEILAAAEAAFVLGCVVAHIHGGETTEGAMDDGFRHAITKLSHLHFVAADEYGRRVVQMGEHPDRVFNVGAPALDVIAATDLLRREELAVSLETTLSGKFFVFTYHPVTMNEAAGIAELRNALAALDEFEDYQVIITGHNADPGHDMVGRTVQEFAAQRPRRTIMRPSLGQQRYLSAMKHCAAVVGNSSSGIIEAPALGVPTVNIGTRQKGRLRAASVIDCDGDRASISAALRRAVSDDFKQTARAAVSPYGTPGAAARMCDVLKSVSLTEAAAKRFFDLPYEAHR